MKKKENLRPEWILREQLNRRINKFLISKDPNVGQKTTEEKERLKKMKSTAKFSNELVYSSSN